MQEDTEFPKLWNEWLIRYDEKDRKLLQEKMIEMHKNYLLMKNALMIERKNTWNLAFGVRAPQIPNDLFNIWENEESRRSIGICNGKLQIVLGKSECELEHFKNAVRALYPVPYDLGMIELVFDASPFCME